MSPSRVALVTGGSRGIGLAVARRLQQEHHRVALTWKTKCPEPLEGPPGTAALFPIECDVTEKAAADRCLEAVEAALGNVEILVCCAGVTEDALLLRMTDEKWDRVLDTNLTAVYRFSKRAVARMIRARYGRIVLVSSVVGHLGQAGQTNYAASKAGLVGFARSLAREMRGRDVTVNVVAPGVIATDMTAALGPERLEALRVLVPAGRLGEPEEVAGAVAWLAADESGYVNGAVVPVDGGLGMGH